MFELTKIFKFDAAHRLSKHAGKCKNLHGHTWVVEVTIGSEKLNSSNMVLDFGDLKKIVAPIIEELDHSLLVNNSDKDLIDFATSLNFRWKSFLADPTSETLAEWFFRKIILPEEIKILNIKVWESPDSFAIYKP